MKKIRPVVIPLLMLVAISLYTIYVIVFVPLYIDGEAYKREFSYPLITGFGVLLTTLGLYMSRSRYVKHAILVLCFLWLTGITNYLPVSWTFTLGFGQAGLSVQIGALLLLIAYYVLYRQRVNEWLLSLVAVDPNSEKAKQARRQEIEKFKSTFRNYPIEKLKLIVTERKLVGSAVLAAKELLEERAAALSNTTT